jgi:acyl dehydratase
MSRMRSVTVGETPPPRVFGPVTQTDIVRFAGAGGDFNPLHHDASSARAAGFDAPIAMGQMTAGILAGWLTDWCGVENLRAYKVRFLAPVHIGDTITASGRIAEVTGGTARLELVATVAETVVVSGSALVHVNDVSPQKP